MILARRKFLELVCPPDSLCTAELPFLAPTKVKISFRGSQNMHSVNHCLEQDGVLANCWSKLLSGHSGGPYIISVQLLPRISTVK